MIAYYGNVSKDETMTITVKKYCAGLYIVSDGEATVDVTYFCPAEGASFYGWVAKGQWSAHVYSDPIYTKREAVEVAKSMIANHHAGEI